MSEELDQVVLTKWDAVKTGVEELEVDVQKAAKGNLSAGVRVRKALRDLRATCTALGKHTLEQEKAARAAKPKKEKKTPTPKELVSSLR